MTHCACFKRGSARRTARRSVRTPPNAATLNLNRNEGRSGAAPLFATFQQPRPLAGYDPGEGGLLNSTRLRGDENYFFEFGVSAFRTRRCTRKCQIVAQEAALDFVGSAKRAVSVGRRGRSLGCRHGRGYRTCNRSAVESVAPRLGGEGRGGTEDCSKLSGARARSLAIPAVWSGSRIHGRGAYVVTSRQPAARSCSCFTRHVHRS